VGGQFRRAGGATGVEQRGQIGGIRCGAVESGAVVCRGQSLQVIDLRPGHGGHVDRRGAGRSDQQNGVDQAGTDETLCHRPGRGVELRVRRDEDPGAGPPHQFTDVLGRECTVDGRGDAGELSRQRRGDQVIAVRGDERNRIMALNTQVAQ